MANSLGDTSASFVESPSGSPNPLLAAWGSPFLPTPAAVGASVPAITGGAVPNPLAIPGVTIDPASGLPVIPGVSTVPGATTLPTTPGGSTVVPGMAQPAVPATPGVYVPAEAPGFWDRYGGAIATGLAAIGAITVAAIAYDRFRSH